jgi:hypothetical protein
LQKNHCGAFFCRWAGQNVSALENMNSKEEHKRTTTLIVKPLVAPAGPFPAVSDTSLFKRFQRLPVINPITLEGPRLLDSSSPDFEAD